MRRIIAASLLCLLWATGVNGRTQENSKPFTKQEILHQLKQPPGQRFEQGDLAAEIAQRGISFPVDEPTLAELRRAGARSFLLEAIKKADPNAPRPHLQPLPATGAQPAVNPTQENRAAENQPVEPVDTPEARAAALARLPLIEQARIHALEFMEELPNFVVTQAVTRSVRTPEHKDWQAEDKFEVELTYRAKQGEQFQMLTLNGKPTQKSYSELGGATSTGEFGSMLGSLFAPQSQADFKEVRHEKFRGRETVVFDFRVKKGNSNSQITDKSSGRTVTAGYQGSVWIDAESKRALRIEVSHDDIQRGFPITLAENAVEYDWVKVGEERYLLPVSAELILGSDSARFYSRNVIELRNYHVFDTDVKLVP